MEVTPLPQTPDKILGAINVQGQVLPVISLRRWLQRPDRELDLEDHLLVVRAGSGRLALLVDEVRGVAEYEPGQATPAQDLAAGVPAACEILKLDDGFVLMPDLEGILSASETLDLEMASSPRELSR